MGKIIFLYLGILLATFSNFDAKSQIIIEGLEIQKGEMKSPTLYVNNSPALSFKVPASWHILSESELALANQNAAKFFEGKVLLDYKQSVVLFMAKQYKTGIRLDINDSFIFTVSGRNIGGQYFKNVNDYFKHVEHIYRLTFPREAISKMEFNTTHKIISGEKFDVLEMKIPLDENKNLVKRHYVQVKEKYILDFVSMFSPEENHTHLDSIINSLKLGKEP